MLTSGDRKAVKEGFKFLVFDVKGRRKCYCTTKLEAIREAGRTGRIVNLTRSAYVANPASRAKKNPYEKMVIGTTALMRQVLSNAPRYTKEYLDGGKQSMTVLYKDRGTLVAEEAITYKRGKVVSSQSMVNTVYLDKIPNPSNPQLVIFMQKPREALRFREVTMEYPSLAKAKVEMAKKFPDCKILIYTVEQYHKLLAQF